MKITSRELRKLILLPLVACCLPFAACSDDDDDPVNQTDIVAELNHINLVPSQLEGDFELKDEKIVMVEAQDELTLFPIECEKPVAEDTEISLKFKPIAVEKYNLYQKKNYKLFKNIEILTPTLTIRKGETKSAESIKVKITDMTELYDGLANHLVPIAVKNMPEAFAEGEKGELLLSFKKKFYPNAISASTDIPAFGLSHTEGEVDNRMSNVLVKRAILANRQAQDDINLVVAIDQSLVAAYNEANGTSYKTFPHVALKESKLQMGMGTDAANLELLFSDNMETVKYGEDYLVPVVIKEVDGAGSFLGEATVAYIPFTSTFTFGIEVRENPVGSKIETYSNWTISVNGTEDSGMLPWNFLLYGWDIKEIPANAPIVLDMKEKTTIKSIHWRSYSDYLIHKLTIGVSDDGVKYQESEVRIENPTKKQNFVFKAPTEARFVRIISDENTYPANLEIYE